MRPVLQHGNAAINRAMNDLDQALNILEEASALWGPTHTVIRELCVVVKDLARSTDNIVAIRTLKDQLTALATIITDHTNNTRDPATDHAIHDLVRELKTATSPPQRMRVANMIRILECRGGADRLMEISNGIYRATEHFKANVSPPPGVPPARLITSKVPLNDASSVLIEDPERPLGGGGLFDLFGGTHIPTGTKLALYQFRFHAQDAQTAAVTVKRLRGQGNLWTTLNHPNVLAFYGILEKEHRTYLLSPWIAHGDLQRFLSARMRWLTLTMDRRELDTNRDAYSGYDESEVVRGIVSGLAYLHTQRIVHGDLKTANILLDDSYQPLVADFGLNQVLERDYSIVATAAPGEGSLRWNSPELLTNVPKTTASDMYAFGMTIVEILTGTVPFADITSDGALVGAIFAGQRPSLEPWNREGRSFDKLWRVASSCWDADPEQRPSALQVAKAMEVGF